MNEIPKFVLNRFQGTIIVQLNLEMAADLLALLNEFENLHPHEYALRCKIQNALRYEHQDVA